MLRPTSVVCALLLLCVFSEQAICDTPPILDVSNLFKKCIETRDDLKSAVKGSLKRAKTTAELEDVLSRGGELMGVIDLNLERLEHLRTLAMMNAMTKEDDSLKVYINAAARTNGKRITRLIEGNLNIIKDVSENVSDPALVTAATGVRDRVREVRDMWASCE